MLLITGDLSTDARQKDTYASFAGSYINESFLDYGVLDETLIVCKPVQ